MVRPTEQISHLAQAMSNIAGIDRDIRVLGKFTRGTLFYNIVHDLKNEKDDVLSEEGKLGQYFVHHFLKEANKHEISNGNIIGASETETKQYLRFLWNKGLTMKGRGNLRRELSNEKSAVYASISDAFKSKFGVLYNYCFCTS
jgi:ribonucleotide reductase beta subunit family protein with ferritin-like domain